MIRITIRGQSSYLMKALDNLIDRGLLATASISVTPESIDDFDGPYASATVQFNDEKGQTFFDVVKTFVRNGEIAISNIETVVVDTTPR